MRYAYICVSLSVAVINFVRRRCCYRFLQNVVGSAARETFKLHSRRNVRTWFVADLLFFFLFFRVPEKSRSTRSGRGTEEKRTTRDIQTLRVQYTLVQQQSMVVVIREFIMSPNFYFKHVITYSVRLDALQRLKRFIITDVMKHGERNIYVFSRQLVFYMYIVFDV